MKVIAASALMLTFLCAGAAQAQMEIRRGKDYTGFRSQGGRATSVMEATLQTFILEHGPKASPCVTQGTPEALDRCMTGSQKAALEYVQGLQTGMKPTPLDVSAQGEEFERCYRQQFHLFGLLPIKFEPPPDVTSAHP